jgi:integrase
MSTRTPLTDAAIKRVALPPPRPFLWDSTVPGFGVRLYSSGRHVFVFQYRTRSRQQRRMSGPIVGTISLNRARKWAGDLHAAVRRGLDPAAEERRKREKEADPEAAFYTIEAVVSDFLKYRLEARNRAPKYIKDCRRALDRFVLPAWKGRDVRDIRRADVTALVRRIVDHLGATPAANRAHETIAALFSFCAHDGKIEQSPAAGLERPAEERGRDRVLTDEELALVWQAAGRLRYPWGLWLRLLLLTGAREREVARLRVEDCDREDWLWNLKASETKAKRATTIPLSRVAVEDLGKLDWPARGHFLTRGWGPKPNASHITAFSHGKRLIDAGLGDAVAHWCIHDLRRTVANGLGRLGVQPHVIAAVLNHAPRRIQGVTALYNRYDYLGEKREALEHWAEHLQAIAQKYPLPLTEYEHQLEQRRQDMLAGYE